MKIEEIQLFKQKALRWADRFDVCCYLDSNNYSDKYGEYDFLIAAGVADELTCSVGNAFETWKAYYDLNKSWMFGFLSYDLKNEIEELDSQNPDHLQFPELYFFIPQYLIIGKNGEVHVIIGDLNVLDLIQNIKFDEAAAIASVKVNKRIERLVYITAVEKMQEHIFHGDIYEANFCQEFFATHAIIDPVSVYLQLKELSPTPFSGYFKQYKNYILAATPERFLCKRGTKLVSQPIKGTAKRSPDPALDKQNRVTLQNNAKERAENVMIVDLVRNDLSKSAVKGSVVVNELFGVYGFPQVYQMISTISCELNPELHFIDAIKNAFPMGSMTGAPKLSAMRLIELLEFSRRGVYSGAMGYIDPSGDFDFNVIIRSLLYNAGEKYLSFQVGSAITYAAEAAHEYEECLLKASAILQTIESKNATLR
ncbi:anthranilate synthase component I family protein [Pedobacter sp. JCM 36344]|uniref:anthranilate synthase component I family protein n=1 Tax=Pedobacter sp. JCM 36344 TaxID=3374280 RepID=UPI00397A9AD3